MASKLSCGSGPVAAVVLLQHSHRGGDIGGGFPPPRSRGPLFFVRLCPGGSLPRVAIPTPVQWRIKPRTCVIKRLLSDPPPWHYARAHTTPPRRARLSYSPTSRHWSRHLVRCRSRRRDTQPQSHTNRCKHSPDGTTKLRCRNADLRITKLFSRTDTLQQ